MNTCKSCGAAITWVKTVNGKAMPLDAVPAKDGNIHVKDGVAYVDSSCKEFGGPHYKSHFATCPGAASHRKKGG